MLHGIRIWRLACGSSPLHWRHNERDGVSENHRRLDCLLNHWFRRWSTKTSKTWRHCPLWVESNGDRWIHSQRVSDAENVFHLMTSSWSERYVSGLKNAWSQDKVNQLFLNWSLHVWIRPSRIIECVCMRVVYVKRSNRRLSARLQ